ncbi:hypothetical protein NSQ62_07750 [Solibacillus sp. FSL H8-0523]|uniref:hypothetical protein n=1 Tax=Solibacillus sp. FSL H8-0523 TaxID=2954511 RepID=UPI0031010608
MIVNLLLHDGIKYSEEISTFDLDQFISEVNTDTHKMIKFGRVGVMKTAIKTVDTIPNEE